MTSYKPIIDRFANGGTQQIYRFDNDYGASVVRHSFSYGGDNGLFELGVIRFKGDEWSLTYDTPITSDVIGYLTPRKVQGLLKKIEALPRSRKKFVSAAEQRKKAFARLTNALADIKVGEQ